jgi:hypothetical protein
LRIGNISFYTFFNDLSFCLCRLFDCCRFLRGGGGLCRPLRARHHQSRDYRALKSKFPENKIVKVPTGDVYAGVY